MASDANNFSDVDLSYPVIVTLQKSINKYYPGTPSFSVPLLVKSGISTKIRNTTTNIANDKKSAIKSTTATKTATMNIKLLKEYTRWYATKYVPAGTKFICVFIGGDINKPYIIGRYDG